MKLTLAVLLLQATATPVSPGPRTVGPLDQARFDECYDTAIADPAAGVAFANRWLIEGGTFFAKQCLGFAYAKGEQYAPAATAFVEAATAAEVARDWRAANLWAQAGNAALAAGDAAAARAHLDAALAQGHLAGQPLGLATLDRARAALALGDFAAGRADLDAAAALVPNDPLVWLLSATLARRQNDLPRAQADIQQAAALGPRDPAIALEAGNIAVTAGNLDGAERSWQSVIAIAPNSAQGATATRQLAELNAVRVQEREREQQVRPASGGVNSADASVQAAPAPVAPAPQSR